MNTIRIGLIINPIAGMGGRVGLKGTDGMVEQAIRLGAIPTSVEMAIRALKALEALKDRITILTGSGEMGARPAVEMDFSVTVCHQACSEADRTTGADTRALVKALLEQQVDLMLFAGGDGTARDLVAAMTGQTPVIGIPTGVKVYSPVFATRPEAAGTLAVDFLKKILAGQSPTKLIQATEVIDLSEDAYRDGRVETSLYGLLFTPIDKKRLQNKKAPSAQSAAAAQAEMAHEVVRDMSPDVAYLIGPGTTTMAVLTALGLHGTLLGIDVVFNKQMLARDASEKTLLEVCSKLPCQLILAPTGGQGFLLGRGNRQLSPNVLQNITLKDICILSTVEKLAEIGHRPLLVDTGDPDIDAKLCGYTRVITGYKAYAMHAVGSPQESPI